MHQPSSNQPLRHEFYPPQQQHQQQCSRPSLVVPPQHNAPLSLRSLSNSNSDSCGSLDDCKPTRTYQATGALSLDQLVGSTPCAQSGGTSGIVPMIVVTTERGDDVQQVPSSPSFRGVNRRLSDESLTTEEDDCLSTISIDELLGTSPAPMWLYQDDAAATSTPLKPAVSPWVSVASPSAADSSDLPFPEHVLHMNSRELKKWLRAQNMTLEAQADVKKQRRRWMNRVYAKRARDKRSLEEIKGGGMCPAQMQAKITRLQAEVDSLRDVQAQLVTIMNTRCPNDLATVVLGN